MNLLISDYIQVLALFAGTLLTREMGVEHAEHFFPPKKVPKKVLYSCNKIIRFIVLRQCHTVLLLYVPTVRMYT